MLMAGINGITFVFGCILAISQSGEYYELIFRNIYKS